MFLIKRYHTVIPSLIVLIILNACQLQEPNKNHGILFLKNRSDQLQTNTSNKNDVIRLIGQPHTKSISDDETWMYFERVLKKGKYHRLGQNIVKVNNVLLISFDKYGILKNKSLFDKNDIETISFSEEITENNLSKKSFAEKFLQSIKKKMYDGK